MVAYVTIGDERDLWLYDVDADAVTRLTDDGEERAESTPVFASGTEVTYIASTDALYTIEAISLDGGAPRELVRVEGRILAHDVRADGSIVYISQAVGGAHRLALTDLAAADPEIDDVILRELGHPPGRGAGSEDEVAVAWSPDGTTILITDTHVSGERTEGVLLVDGNGEDVLSPWTGTHARWSDDGETIYYRGHAEAGGVGWFELDPDTGRARTLDWRPGSNNPAVGPNGMQVAYDSSYFGDERLGVPRSGEAPAVYTYALPEGPEVMLLEGAMAPLWIGPDELLVTDVKRANPRRSLNSWEELGTVTRISLDGTRRTTAMTRTWFAAVWLEQPSLPNR